MQLDGDLILIDPPLPESKELGARWDARRGKFTLPATRANVAAYRDAYPDTPDAVSARLGPSRRVLAPPSGAATTRLYPYQLEAAARLVDSPRGAIVVLSPGLGKTAVAIAAADAHDDASVLVVCPASLVPNWEREIDMWGQPDRSTWTVTTWDKAARAARQGDLGAWDIVILDESVMTKSRASQRFKAFNKDRKKWGKVWLLSGNPITRYADDLWAQLHLIWPAAFPSYWRFARRYCVIEETPWGDKVVGTRAKRNALEENGDLVIVVNQEDVLDLPEYLFEVVDVALGPKQRKAYASMASDFIAELADGTEKVADNELGRLLALQQIAAWWDGESAKHDALIDLLPTYDGPHLIWTHWRESADSLTDALRAKGYRVAHVKGGMPEKLRDAWLEDFKGGLIDCLVLSLGVGKFGHTFTNARTVHYVDKTWNADDYFQSLRRVRRIGLKHRPVVVTYRAPGTTDELVEMNLGGKLPAISRMTKSDLAELLRGLGKEVS